MRKGAEKWNWKNSVTASTKAKKRLQKTSRNTCSLLAEYGHENGVSVSSLAEENERLKEALKGTDAYLRPYMEEFLSTVFALSGAFRSEIIDDLED